MKKHIAPLLATMALVGVAPLGLASEHDAYTHANDKTTAKDVHRELADTTETIKNYSADKRDEATVKAKAALDALDVRINALETQIDQNWEKMDKAAREQARSTLDVLHKKRIETAEWYGALKNSTAKAWEHMKHGFSDAYKSLRTASEKAEREYQKDDRKQGN